MQKIKGFTMVEISLSMAFISILSITIVILISNTVTTYHRGMVLNQINTVGMAIVDDIRSSIQTAPTESLTGECSALYLNATQEAKCEADKGLSFVTAERYANVQYTDGQAIGNVPVPVYGIFCTGSYSYIWNSGYLLNKTDYSVSGITDGIRVNYKMAGASSTEMTVGTARLVKIIDEDRMVCKKATGYNSNQTSDGGSYTVSTSSTTLPNTIDISERTIEEAPENILEENGNMVMYDLSPSAPAMNDFSNSTYMEVSFILGTLQGGININAQSDYCKTPEGGVKTGIENFDYCAINKFNFAARSLGR